MNNHPRTPFVSLVQHLIGAAVMALLMLVRCAPGEDGEYPICAEPGKTSCEVRHNCTGVDSPCVLRSCEDGCCGTAPAPPGTRVLVKLNPDDACRRVVCNEYGGMGCAEPLPGHVCGDGECTEDEGCDVCPMDCGICPSNPGAPCGDGKCEIFKGEGCSNCSEDCGSCCGDGTCDEPYESCEECASDCCP